MPVILWPSVGLTVVAFWKSPDRGSPPSQGDTVPCNGGGRERPFFRSPGIKMATGATVSLQWFVYIEITLLSKHSLESGCTVSGTAALQADYSIKQHGKYTHSLNHSLYYNSLFYFLSLLQFLLDIHSINSFSL